MHYWKLPGALCVWALAALLVPSAEGQAVFRGSVQPPESAEDVIVLPKARTTKFKLVEDQSFEPVPDEGPTDPPTSSDGWTSGQEEIFPQGADGSPCPDSSYCDSPYCNGLMGSTPYFGFAAGVEATYLKPHLNGGEFLNPFENFDNEAAPRIWAMWQGPRGWGARFRYWAFDAEAQFTTADDFGDLAGAQFANDNLEAYAIDVELTRYFRVNRTEGWASFGTRNARLHRQLTQQSTLFDLAGGGGDDASVIQGQFDRGFDGTGITMALDLRRPVFDSGFAAICNLRGSVLWGTNELAGSLTVIEAVPVGAGDLDLNDFQTISARASDGDSMWIGELQVGGEWSTPLSSNLGGGNAFVRLLFEAQWWHLNGVSLGGMFPDADHQIHEFMGITMAAGFMR